tara:strand:- start:5906 stop:6667 length:762 start_codon:yes stop_codon:yes gene_type:complete
VSDDYNDIPTNTDSLYPPGTLNPDLWNKGEGAIQSPGLVRRAEGILSGGRYGALEARLEQVIDFIEGMGWNPSREGPFNAQVLAPYVSSNGVPGYITIEELRNMGCVPLTNWLSRLTSQAQVPDLLPAVWAIIPELDVGRPTPQAYNGGPALGVDGDALSIETYRIYVGNYEDPPSLPAVGSVIKVDFFDKNPNLRFGIYESIVVEHDWHEAYDYNNGTSEDSAQAAFGGSGLGADGQPTTTLGEMPEGDETA